jgi:hypothetical protein
MLTSEHQFIVEAIEAKKGGELWIAEIQIHIERRYENQRPSQPIFG